MRFDTVLLTVVVAAVAVAALWIIGDALQVLFAPILQSLHSLP